MTPEGLPAGAVVLAGPERVGSELRWSVRLADGQPALLGSLAGELARDPALRRRYVRDITRLRELAAPGVAPVLAIGPEVSPGDPESAPPWRLRADPPGETLEQRLARRAPLPIDEAVELAIALATLLGPLHARGLVLRDLHPRLVVLASASEGPPRLVLTDVGLGRVDILTTRTAASLLLEGSPYAAPEQFQRTALDPRADLYAIGVILYRALTGLLPRGDGPAFLAESPVAPPRRLRPELPVALDELVLRCLAIDPNERPASARELVDALRGEASGAVDGQARVACQHCAAPLRLGQRLCLSCGRVAVQFAAEEGGEYAVMLRSAREDASFMAGLQATVSPLHDGPVPAFNFLIGDARMYSKGERERRHRLPLPLFNGLSRATAEALQARLKAAGLAVKVKRGTVQWGRALSIWLGLGVALPVGLWVVIGFPVVVLMLFMAMSLVAGGMMALALRRLSRRRRAPFLRLRSAPALPASDPLVARLAALLTPDTASEVRERVGGLALAVQRLVDHRAAAPGERAEVDALTRPVAPLIAVIESQVTRLRALDAGLAELDEGTLVRALAASEARDEPAHRRGELLAGLDRLRSLEDERAAIFHRLLEAESLLRRSVELGLGVHDEQAEQARRVAQALHALGDGE